MIQKKEQVKNTVADFIERSNKEPVKPTAPVVAPPVKAPTSTVAEKEVIPPKPRMSELAHEYEMRLEEIMDKLKHQNRAIHEQEAEKELIDEDLKNCTGLFKGKKRKEL